MTDMTPEEIPELLRFTAIYRCFQIRAIPVAAGVSPAKTFLSNAAQERRYKQ
jgi:hypothetical protein